jgi:UPF0755 protein
VAKAVRKVLAGTGVLVLLGSGLFVTKVRSGLAQLPSGPDKVIRFRENLDSSEAFRKLEEAKIIRDAGALGWYAKYKRTSSRVRRGSYRLHPGMTADEVLNALKLPVVLKVRLRENEWASRAAKRLESEGVCKAKDYMALVNDPASFASSVSFPLPKTSLEGYLFPDTYNFAPEMDPREVIETQLKTFEKKVWDGLNQPKNLDHIVNVAAMVELEASRKDERGLVAGIIENRLAKGMKLQIDATVLYAKQVWKDPTGRDVRETVSPYNTYKVAGLPPTPICSPSMESLRAAASPTKSDFLYYVGLPNGTSLFAKTYEEHLVNVKKMIAARKAAQK